MSHPYHRPLMCVVILALLVGVPASPAGAQDAPPATLIFEEQGIIYTIHADGTNLRAIAAGSTPRWSPDGREIAFWWEGALLIVPATGGEPRQRVPANVRPGSIQWQADGTRLIYEQVDPPGLYAVAAAGDPEPHLITTERPALALTSPQGQRVAFAPGTFSDRGSRSTPYLGPLLVALDSATPPTLISAGDVHAFDWSPTGDRLGYLTTSNDSRVLTLSIATITSAPDGTPDSTQSQAYDISAALAGEALVMPPQINWSCLTCEMIVLRLVTEGDNWDGASQRLSLVNPADGTVTPVVADSDRIYPVFPAYQPQITPDASALLYMETECEQGYLSPGSYARVWRVSLDTGADTPPTLMAELGGLPACVAFQMDRAYWRLAPDGSQIAFRVTNDIGPISDEMLPATYPDFGLYVTNAQGSDLRRIYEGEYVASIAWRPR